MIHNRIRELREKKGLLQIEISRHINVTREAYSLYETGKRQMNYETLCLLADFYNVSTDYLLGRQDALPSFLSEEERVIIAQYKELSEHAKETVKNCLAFEYSRLSKANNGKKTVM